MKKILGSTNKKVVIAISIILLICAILGLIILIKDKSSVETANMNNLEEIIQNDEGLDITEEITKEHLEDYIEEKDKAKNVKKQILIANILDYIKGKDKPKNVKKKTIVENILNQIKEKDKINNAKTSSNESKTTNNGKRYYIKVNYGANVVTIYTKDESNNYTVPVKAMVCSTGRGTPRSGAYGIKGRWEWGNLFGGVYGHYVTKIVGNVLFHSVPYLKKYDPSSIEYWEYDKLGTSASSGCIRLTVSDAKWIYNNVETGTLVEFYSSSDPGPLGKPSAQKISGNVECRGWDPTDSNENNPWHNYNKPTDIIIESTIPEDNTTNDFEEEVENATNNTQTNEIIEDENQDDEFNNVQENEINTNNIIDDNQIDDTQFIENDIDEETNNITE